MHNGLDSTQSESIPLLASLSEKELLHRFKAGRNGLSSEEASSRHRAFGYNEPAKKKETPLILQMLHEFKDPLSLVLIAIATFSLVMGQTLNAGLIYGMVLVGAALSFLQEYKAGKEAKKLTDMVSSTATVLRSGEKQELKIRMLVPGDIIYLSAGDIIPADVCIISDKDLHINQSALTGEAYPVRKSAGSQHGSISPLELKNIAFMGSNVVNGSAVALVVKTGGSTEFGRLALHVTEGEKTETSFDIGVAKYIGMMIKIIAILVVVTFALNLFSKGYSQDKLFEYAFFSLAVAVGLAPEMLPMMIAVNLSNGAVSMSKKRVIVKKLSAIQNFGAMDVLCTDKTGTLTLGEVVLERYFDLAEKESGDVLQYAYLNSSFQTGLRNVMDQAILGKKHVPISNFKKVDEVPFDFERKMMSVVVAHGGKHILITKGAPEKVIALCTSFEVKGKVVKDRGRMPARISELSDKYRRDGFRVLALAYREFPKKKTSYSKADESGMVLKGFMVFLDPPKPSTKKAIASLESMGIKLKVLTGDNELVTRKICSEVGIDVSGVLVGDQIEKMGEKELSKAVESTSVFARLTPLQKERIIIALKKNGHSVGYMGDGINDAPSLKNADVGISVDNAADIAKETADIILLKKSLMVVADGVVEGRKTHANILKYIKMGSSSNFGNMFSVTGASMFLPFLPMMPIQILLNNFLYDMSQLTIPTDNVDREQIERPSPWDVDHIKKMLLYFGPVSSIFDFLTFGACLLLGAAQPLFHTVWFLESLITQTLVIHIVRTPKIPFLQSSPSRPLLISSFAIVAIGWLIVYSPVAAFFGFEAPPMEFVLIIIGISLAYFATMQLVKGWFAKRFGWQ